MIIGDGIWVQELLILWRVAISSIALIAGASDNSVRKRWQTRMVM
jgi:hypothetical protein